MTVPATQQLFEQAVAHHRAGRRDDARLLYTQVIQIQPNNAQALRLLAAIELDNARPQIALDLSTRAVAAATDTPTKAQAHAELARALAALGQTDRAIDEFNSAISFAPRDALVHYNLGNLLARLDRVDLAIASFRAALSLNSAFTQARRNLAAALLKANRSDDAIREYRALAADFPADAQVAHDLAVALARAGRYKEAATAFARTVALRPGSADALNALGDALLMDGQFARAVEACERGLPIDPNHPWLLLTLGRALVRLNNLESAASTIQKAIVIRPDFPEALSTLACVLSGQHENKQAADACERAITLQPNYAPVWSNLAMVRWRLGDNDGAVAAARHALALDPDLRDAWINLGVALKDHDQLDEAAEAFCRAVAIDPRVPEAHINLSHTLKDQGLMRQSLDEMRAAIACDPDSPPPLSDLAYTAHFHPDYDGHAILRECVAFEQRFAKPLTARAAPHVNDADAHRRLRLGYLGSDFNHHCQSFFTVPLFEAHDHNQFEVVCYSSTVRADALTNRLRAATNAWHDIAKLSHQEAADLIREHRIDILIDLTMHMARGRPLLMARKPAPVQMAWLAYPGTTGLSAVDYRLTDPWLDPPGEHDDDYAETSLRLADTFWIYNPLTTDPAVGDLPAASSGRITFGCLNNFCKITDATLQLWSTVLAAIPDARMIIMAPSGSSRRRVLDTLHTHGIERDRITFVTFQPRDRYLQTYQQIDIALDTIPYNGHTTSLDAFWMGVPVVTLVGRTAVSRAGWSQLNNLNLTELAATDADGFRRICVGLAADYPTLAAIRAGLRPRMQRSPLMDAPRFARSIEEIYRSAWTKWCAARG